MDKYKFFVNLFKKAFTKSHWISKFVIFPTKKEKRKNIPRRTWKFPFGIYILILLYSFNYEKI